MFKSPQRALAVLAIALVVIAALAVRAQSASMLGSFRAFYCAGSVANDGGSAYEAKPLGTCEHALQPASLFRGLSVPVLPAPLPGYLLGLFQIFARLPFWLAALVWFGILVAALALSIALFARLRIAPPLPFALASAMAIFGVSILDGEPIPIAMLGVALLALGITRKRTWAVALGFLLVMAQPQIGIVVGLALAILDRRWLVTVAASLLALLLLSIAVSGLPQTVAYVTTYLPLHIASEVHVTLQYSPTWMAGALGASDAAAIWVGRASYALAAAAAAVLAFRVRAQSDRALLICAVPAIALCGSSYTHLDHIGLAMPAALAVASGRFKNSRPAMVFAVCLAVPMLFALGDRWLMLLVPLVAASLAGLLTGSTRQAIWGGVAAALALVAIAVVSASFGLGERPLAPLPVHTPELASESWNNYVRAHVNATAWTIWLVKLPTWIGLYGTAAAAWIALTSEGRSRSD